jgi:hypothetical protein
MRVYQFNDETGHWLFRVNLEGAASGFGTSAVLSATGEYIIAGEPGVASTSGKVRIYRAL